MTPRPSRTLLAGLAVATAAVSVPLVSFLGGSASAAPPGPFTTGDLVVYRVGTGSDLTNAATAVFLDELTPTGTLVQSVPLPTAADGAQHPVTAVGQSSSEGLLGRSADGRYLTATGYAAALGTTGPGGESLTASAPVDVPRVIARIDGNAAVESSTALGDTSAPTIVRSAATTDGSRFWLGGGAAPLSTETLGQGTGTAVAGTANSSVYGVEVVDGQLYSYSQDYTPGAPGTPPVQPSVSSALAAVGAGTPTGATTATALPGLPAHALVFGYALLDLDTSTPGPDTLYYADGADRGGAVHKFSLVSGTWTDRGAVALDGAFGLAAVRDGSDVELYVSTARTVSKLTDSSAAGSTLSATFATVYTAADATELRGLALAPTPVGGPSVVLSTAEGASTPDGATAFPVSAVVTSSGTVSGVTASLDSGPTQALTLAGGHWSGSIPLAGVAAGHHTLTVTATDTTAGHSAGTATRGITTGGPAATTTTNPPPVVTTSPGQTVVVPPPAASTVLAGYAQPGKLDLSANQLVKKSGFSVVKLKGTVKGKGLQASKKGTITVPFQGSAVTVDLRGGPKAGKVQLFVDGRSYGVVDLYAAKTKTFLKTIKGLKAGAHTLKVVALNSKRAKSKGKLVVVGYVLVKL